MNITEFQKLKNCQKKKKNSEIWRLVSDFIWKENFEKLEKL